MAQSRWGTACRFLTKLHTLFPYDPEILLPGIYPKELKPFAHKTCTWVFTAALFVTAKPWKQPECPSAGEWTKYYIQTTEYQH